ncbi:MAG: (Na+)-NQR maturation NqrM [Ectothiorhodospiraceae bacterium]|nr:(Na+)-NQR maturation NqrM [Ectothiorhodospiraceae bacterium]
MFTTLLVAIVLFFLLFAGMAIGVILSNKPIKGSCGGLGAAGFSGDCEICGGDRDRCREENEGAQPGVSETTRTSRSADNTAPRG